MNEANKNVIFKKNMDLVVAYLLIFSFGLVVVFSVVNFLNNKVNQFTDVYEDMDTKK